MDVVSQIWPILHNINAVEMVPGTNSLAVTWTSMAEVRIVVAYARFHNTSECHYRKIWEMLAEHFIAFIGQALNDMFDSAQGPT